VGNGMAMAIHSAKLAADTIHFLENRIDRATLENNYLNDWNKKKRLQVGRYWENYCNMKKNSTSCLENLIIFLLYSNNKKNAW
jgi:flavin-dependent dehydrogenase